MFTKYPCTVHPSCPKNTICPGIGCSGAKPGVLTLGKVHKMHDSLSRPLILLFFLPSFLPSFSLLSFSLSLFFLSFFLSLSLSLSLFLFLHFIHIILAFSLLLITLVAPSSCSVHSCCSIHHTLFASPLFSVSLNFSFASVAHLTLPRAYLVTPSCRATRCCPRRT